MQRRLLRRMMQGCVCGLAGEQRHSAKINGSCRDIVFAASSIKSWPEGYLYRFRHAHWRHPGSGRSLFDPQVGQRTPSHAGRRISWDASRDRTVPIPHRGPAEIVMCMRHRRMRPIASVTSDGDGGYRCLEGEPCVEVLRRSRSVPNDRRSTSHRTEDDRSSSHRPEDCRSSSSHREAGAHRDRRPRPRSWD